MKSRLTWRNLLIAFLILLGVSGVIEALPHASETTGDLLIDAGILVLIVAISASRVFQICTAADLEDVLVDSHTCSSFTMYDIHQYGDFFFL